jgi:hypothetical protein
VLLEADYFRRHLAGGNEGEDIWAKSMLDALVELGYSLVITAGRDETNKVYADLGGAVAAVIMTRDGMKECVDSSRGGRKGGCLESEQNPFGIPVWKVNSLRPGVYVTYRRLADRRTLCRSSQCISSPRKIRIRSARNGSSRPNRTTSAASTVKLDTSAIR